MSVEISDRLARLKKLADRLETRALHCDDMMLPSVAAQLRLTLSEIDALQKVGQPAAGGAANEIATRAAARKGRQSAAKNSRTA